MEGYIDFLNTVMDSYELDKKRPSLSKKNVAVIDDLMSGQKESWKTEVNGENGEILIVEIYVLKEKDGVLKPGVCYEYSQNGEASLKKDCKAAEVNALNHHDDPFGLRIGDFCSLRAINSLLLELRLEDKENGFAVDLFLENRHQKSNEAWVKPAESNTVYAIQDGLAEGFVVIEEQRIEIFGSVTQQHSWL
ncbi:hypothetical protein [Aureibacter tunicatorum]|uniref:Uncharacterized protein n=1 Tax=Aureibacter tunicatorum TaxID=866807 RepID=A0AAE3XGC4_9BACT|nr:hypothetical protein [Aureibacter tunicatorum]MDR6237081.1 hypothetical protein [Aureibacter tunicatorum]BDD06073.1 hypothetical protein AUTU_35560 [Aureibacter tunicatorum]